jgi:hypothetical protein
MMLVKSERARVIEWTESELKRTAEGAEALRRAVAGRKPRALDIKVLLEIAKTAKIPESDLELFFHWISSLVVMSYGVAQRDKLWQASSDLGHSSKRIAAAARNLATAIEEASDGAQEWVRLGLPSPRPRTLDEFKSMAQRLADAAGRTHHVPNPWRFFKKVFLEQLCSDVRRANGKLTYNETGTLMSVLTALEPYLPEKFAFSFSTVRRIRRGSKN